MELATYFTENKEKEEMLEKILDNNLYCDECDKVSLLILLFDELEEKSPYSWEKDIPDIFERLLNLGLCPGDILKIPTEKFEEILDLNDILLKNYIIKYFIPDKSFSYSIYDEFYTESKHSIPLFLGQKL